MVILSSIAVCFVVFSEVYRLVISRSGAGEKVVKLVPESEFSFCESTHAGSNTKWHIRKLTHKGRKLGGGIDTKSLCGFVTPERGGWDSCVFLSAHHIKHNTCSACAEKYKKYVCGC